MSLQKPKKHKKDYWDYFEVEHYLEKKYQKNFDDLWSVICDYNEVHNGGFIFLPEIREDYSEQIKEILGYFEEFLGNDYFEEMRVSW